MELEGGWRHSSWKRNSFQFIVVGILENIFYSQNRLSIIIQFSLTYICQAKTQFTNGHFPIEDCLAYWPPSLAFQLIDLPLCIMCYDRGVRIYQLIIVIMRSADICQAMLKFALKFPENQAYDCLKLEHFSDGLPFAHMLIHSNTISLSLGELEVNSGKWIAKVGNLKKMLSKINGFMEVVNEKTDRIKDIDVVQIAKNCSQEHLARFFEVLVSVLMNSPAKEKYIQLIMAMDEPIQNTFVEIIQNSLDQQIFPPQQSTSIIHLQEELTRMKKENAQLKNELNEAIKKYKSLQRDVEYMREKLICFEQEQEKTRKVESHSVSDGLQSQLEQQRVLIDNLKIKLISTVRQNQMELSQLRQQVSLLRLKTKNMEEVQSTLQQYKEMYNQNLNDQQRLIELEKEKRRLGRQVEEKDQMIKKLQGRVEATIQKNYSMQQNQIYMKLELQKRQVRFKQLQKEVKTRLKSQPSELNPKINELDPHQQEKEEMLYLQDQLNKAKIGMKQLQKQSIKNRKRLQRMSQLQAQKKKLQRIVLEVNRSKDAEIEMLVVSLYDLRNENIRLFSMVNNPSESNGSHKKL